MVRGSVSSQKRFATPPLNTSFPLPPWARSYLLLRIWSATRRLHPACSHGNTSNTSTLFQRQLAYMVFSDLFFLFVFLPSCAILYLLAGLIDRKSLQPNGRPVNTLKNAVLVLFSLIFYAWGEPVYVFLMLGCVLWNYLGGLALTRFEQYRGFALFLGVVGNLVILGTFKYAGLIADTLTSWGIPVANPHIALPIGVSFYTFQSMSYLIDVYRRESPVQKSFGNLLLYVSMFPQLVAGPIVRYSTVAAQIQDRRVTAQDFAEGVYRFLIGLGKKVILANQFSEIVTQFLGGNLQHLTTSGAWLGILAFTFQIYFDFSGYSDMAIGMGRCLGFHFNENFAHPYISRSITEFWRRWHISLGSFFRDYVYIPLGGNRRHQAFNILAVWFLTGLWHGASWNFVLWGMYFGFIVMLEKYTLLRFIHRVPRVLLHLYSLLLIVVGWGIFYFDDFTRLGQFFHTLVGGASELHSFITTGAVFDHFWLWIAAIVLSMPLRNGAQWLTTRALGGESSGAYAVVATLGRVALSVGILALSVALLVGATNNAFIYTRF